MEEDHLLSSSSVRIIDDKLLRCASKLKRVDDEISATNQMLLKSMKHEILEERADLEAEKSGSSYRRIEATTTTLF